MSRRGYSLIEVIVGGSLFAVVIVLTSIGLNRLTKLQKVLLERGSMGSDMVSVVRFIERVGRVAQFCRKGTMPSGSDSLECNIDFSRPANGTMEWVRFGMTGAALQYQFDSNNNGAFATTTLRSSYPGVSSFEVCDDGDMNLPTGGCTIEPLSISTFHTNALAMVPSKANRFFRFSVRSTQVSDTPGKGLGEATILLSGAFYRRNPTPFTSPIVVYQW